MNKQLSKRNIVKQSDTITTAKYKLTSVEMKFISLVIAQIKMEDTDLSIYDIKISELEDIFGKEIDYNTLKNFAKSLLSKPFQIQLSDGWIVLNWFSSIRYVTSESKFVCKIDDNLKPYLLKMQNHFTKYELSSLIRMNSIYAMRIYQMLNTYDAKYRGHLTIEVKKLQEMLQVPKSLLGYGQFKQKVLEVAINEINAKTNLSINLFENKKILKKVIEIRFEIRKVELESNEEKEIRDFERFIIENYKNKPIYQDLDKVYYMLEDVLCSKDKFQKVVKYFGDSSDVHYKKLLKLHFKGSLLPFEF